MNINKLKGFSLVELMVAMVVGLIILTGVFSLHTATRETQLANEAQMDMVADARFAIKMIGNDLRHAGMWGATNKDGLIECRSTAKCTTSTSTGDAPPANVPGDCAAGWYYNLMQPIFATDSSAGNPYASSCIPAGEGYMGGTDILEVKYADPNLPVGGLTAGQIYVRSNYMSGRLFNGTMPAPELPSHDSSPITNNYVLHAYAYYISNFTDSTGDGIPSLRRATLVNGPSIQNQTVISGVTDLQVQFGEDIDGVEDANGNFSVDRYVDPDKVSDWTAVYSAKIWLLMRADAQRDITKVKSFTLAGATANYGADGYRYFMVSSVINLRNTKQL